MVVRGVVDMGGKVFGGSFCWVPGLACNNTSDREEVTIRWAKIQLGEDGKCPCVEFIPEIPVELEHLGK